jgi:hypothetical protein
MAFVSRSDVYRATGLPDDGTVISDNDIDMHIVAAESLVEKRYVGTCLQPGGRQITETIDGSGTNTLLLDNYPVLSLDALSVSDGTTDTTVTTTKVWLWGKTGKLQLKSDAEVTQFNSAYPQLVTVQYTYGRVAEDYEIEFTACIAALKVLAQQIGGTFDDITSFQLPELSGSLGEPYTNIREAMARLSGIISGMLEQGLIRRQPQFG